jgi:hypothetical protein
MSYFNDYQYGLQQVTASCVDTNNANYLWVAMAQNNGACILKKVSAFDPLQVYYTISVPVSSINAMAIVNGYIFLAVNHSTIFSIAYSLSNPSTTFISMNKPAGIVEGPISLITDATDVYFLTPGSTVGTFSAIIKTNLLNVFQEKVIMNFDSISVHNSVSVTIDASFNLWIITNQIPGALIRLWTTSGHIWNIQQTQLI